MTHQRPPAEQITAYLTELHDEVRTAETILRYRTVNRGRRSVAVPDFVIHRTNEPGLLEQARRAAVPQGSPGWDEDGALSPMPSGGSFESQEPVAEAFHLADSYAKTMADIAEIVHAAGYRTPVEAALADERVGRRIAGMLRSLVAHCRVVLGYDAPVTPLRDVYCPDCGGKLHVRADASSAVWCTGRITVAGPLMEGDEGPLTVRCDASWPRGSWVKLLEDVTEKAS